MANKLIEPGKWCVEFDELGNIINIDYSDTYYKLLGFTEKEKKDFSYKNWISRIHPDDKETVENEYRKTIRKHPEGFDFDVEYRMMTKWGYRWFHDYGYCARAKDGSVISCNGVIFDINDAKSMNVNLGAIPLSHEVLRKSNIGLWAVEIDPDTPPRLYGDEAMLKLLYIEGKVTPEEAYHALDDHIDKEHYQEVHQALDRMCLGFHAEVQYPWYTPEGETLIIRCGGIRNPKYTKGIRVEGVHRDITNLAHFDREKELIEKIRESEKVTDVFIDTYTLVFKVNLEEDSFSIIKRDNSLIRSPKVVHKFSEALSSFLQNIVFEKDKAKIRKQTDYANIRKRLENSLSFSFDYRVLNGKITEWHEMNIAKFDENQVVIGIANKNNEIIYKYLHEKMNEDFFALFYIDLDTGYLKTIRKADWYTYCNEGDVIKYQELMEIFASSLEGEPKEFFLKHCDNEYTKQMFAKEDKRSFSYKSNLLKSKPWVTVTEYVISRDKDGVLETLALGFSILDSLGADKQELQNQLKQAVDMAQSANRAKTTFLNNMSHDIRTPMNAIIGYTELAKKHIENKDQIQDYLGKISHSSDHLLSLINDVLDMSRIESGKMSIEEKNENLYEIIETVKDIVQADIQAKNLSFNVSYENVQNTKIICDKLRIKQVLLNIISNSIKYTPNNGSIILEINEKQSKRKDSKGFEFIISDTGMGMTKEFLKKIFEPFTRVNSTTVSGIQGTGLGMPITKNLVERMGGNIEIESEPGKGTVVKIDFTFKLHKEKDENKSDETTSSKNIEKQEIDFTGKRILLVEDNELNREIATIFLEENGFVIIPAEDGTVAVEKMKAAKTGDFDLILMDIQMPLMNGYEATKQIRALKSKVKDIPIVAMTANAFEEDKKMAFEVGMNDYIAKPINLDTLKNVLSKIL